MSDRQESTQVVQLPDSSSMSLRMVQNPVVDDVVIFGARSFLTELETGVVVTTRQVPRSLVDFFVRLGVDR